MFCIVVEYILGILLQDFIDGLEAFHDTAITGRGESTEKWKRSIGEAREALRCEAIEIAGRIKLRDTIKPMIMHPV